MILFSRFFPCRKLPTYGVRAIGESDFEPFTDKNKATKAAINWSLRGKRHEVIEINHAGTVRVIGYVED